MRASRYTAAKSRVGLGHNNEFRCKPQACALLLPGMPISMSDLRTIDHNARFQEGLALHRIGALDSAAAMYREILLAAPRNFNALHMLGVIHMQRGEPKQAAELIRQALTVDGRQPAAYGNLASALIELRDFTGAIENCNRALALKPDDVEAFYNRATALRLSGRWQGALDSFSQALVLQPGHVAALIGRGTLLQILQQLEPALIDLDAAVTFAPANSIAHYNHAHVLKALHRVNEAEASFRQAIRLAPDFAEGHVGLAECLFLKGDEAVAWAEYEWRWRTAGLSSLLRKFAVPQWNCRDDIKGKTILLHAEQGFGDAVQFVRYAKAFAALGAKVILEVQPPLKGLLANLQGVASVLARGEALPQFDAHCPLMSLPLAFGSGKPSAPYLIADANKADVWRLKLGATKKRRIGLSWSGSTTHANDAQRSIPLQTLAPILALDADIISVQKDVRDSDRAAMAEFSNAKHWGEDLTDFTETAALMSAVDVVISVDTVTAHLAGALGKPVWILLPHAPDWRWGQESDQTSWYPSARLYRQAVRGDWQSVIARVATDLKSYTS